MRRRRDAQRPEVFGAAPEKVQRARELRGAPTDAEARLWSCLRKGQMGWRFRRQHVVAGFIVDFYCPALRLAVEVDGPVHDARRDYDAWRDEYLRRRGISIMRVRNDDVLGDLASTLVVVRTVLSNLAPLSPPPDSGGGRVGGFPVPRDDRKK